MSKDRESSSVFIRREPTEIARKLDPFFGSAAGRYAESRACDRRYFLDRFAFSSSGKNSFDPLKESLLTGPDCVNVKDEDVTTDMFFERLNRLEDFNRQNVESDRTAQRALHEVAQRVEKMMDLLIERGDLRQDDSSVQQAKTEIKIAMQTLEYFEYPLRSKGLQDTGETRSMSPN